ESQLPEPKRRMLRSLEVADPSLAQRRVLVVDDDFRNVFAITALLEQHHMAVDYAENGAKALEKLSGEQTYAVVLMDIMMPEMDGYEAMRRVRAMPGFESLPIIALTANALPGDDEKCYAAGMNGYLPKPFRREDLRATLAQWIPGGRPRPESDEADASRLDLDTEAR
ncbi:MAG: response regulator, partial [Planctomycetes bacterium]|nr:response regulator [Planctomycetota bacterium]